MFPPGKFASLTLPAEPRSRGQLWLGTRDYWLFQVVLWLVFISGIDVVSALVAYGTVGGFDILSAFAFGVEMLAGTHFARVVLLAARARPCPARRLALLAVLASFLCGLVVAALAFTFALPFGTLSEATGSDLLRTMYSYTYTGASHGAFWIAAYAGLMFLRAMHAAEVAGLRAAAAAQEAELAAIRAQINPHFLFNALNTVRALIPSDEPAPREAITRLSELLRSALTATADETIPLRRELETVDAYLALEGLRFEERLRVSREVDAAALECRIPPFALQTLVENAVKYGVATRAGGGEIRIVASTQPGRISLRVTNPGRIAADTDSTGLGLRNTVSRLGHVFGDEARLTLIQSEPELVTAELTLPAAA